MTGENTEALLSAEEGWVAINFPQEYAAGRSYVVGDADRERLRVRYFIDTNKRCFTAKVYFGKNAQGPPFHAHGGSQAAVLDEAMGLGAWVENHSVVAAQVRIDYLKMLPLESVVRVIVQTQRSEGKKVWMEAHITDDAGTVYSRGEGLYIVVPKEKLLNDSFHRQLAAQVDEIMGRT